MLSSVYKELVKSNHNVWEYLRLRTTKQLLRIEQYRLCLMCSRMNTHWKYPWFHRTRILLWNCRYLLWLKIQMRTDWWGLCYFHRVCNSWNCESVGKRINNRLCFRSLKGREYTVKLQIVNPYFNYFYIPIITIRGYICLPAL